MTSIKINRAPVLTLWGVVVAERMGYPRETALTLGKAVAGLNAQSKGRSLGLFKPGAKPTAKKRATHAKPATIELMGRAVPVVRTKAGLRAAIKGEVAQPDAVERYLRAKFGDALPDAERAMKKLAASYAPKELAGQANSFYERFRPEIPAGIKGWGAAGELDTEKIESLAR